MGKTEIGDSLGERMIEYVIYSVVVAIMLGFGNVVHGKLDRAERERFELRQKIDELLELIQAQSRPN